MEDLAECSSEYIISNHGCTMSCRSFPQMQDDCDRLQRTRVRTSGRVIVWCVNTYEFGSVNYSWRRVVCIACENHMPAYRFGISNEFRVVFRRSFLVIRVTTRHRMRSRTVRRVFSRVMFHV